MNDRGGVHINSSLLNLTAARLTMDYGMPPETAKVYWLTVASCMTPDMDYPQLAELLKYATIIISSLPLMIMYPFFQRYFDNGIMAGAIKG